MTATLPIRAIGIFQTWKVPRMDQRFEPQLLRKFGLSALGIADLSMLLWKEWRQMKKPRKEETNKKERCQCRTTDTPIPLGKLQQEWLQLSSAKNKMSLKKSAWQKLLNRAKEKGRSEASRQNILKLFWPEASLKSFYGIQTGLISYQNTSACWNSGEKGLAIICAFCKKLNTRIIIFSINCLKIYLK